MEDVDVALASAMSKSVFLYPEWQSFGMTNRLGCGESIRYRIAVYFYAMGNRSCVQVALENFPIRVSDYDCSRNVLFWRDSLSEEQGKVVFEQTTEAFRTLVKTAGLQWVRE